MTPFVLTVRAPALLAALILAAPAMGQQAMDHSAHGHPEAAQEAMDMSAAQPGDTPATAAYRQAMAAMHDDMATGYTNDADVDFMRGMIPHHQGAIDMARIVLEHGTDAQVRALAQDVIETQQAEIEMMEAWLARRGE